MVNTPRPLRSAMDKLALVSGMPKKLNPLTSRIVSARPVATAMPKYSNGRNGIVFCTNEKIKIKPNPPKAAVRLIMTARRINDSGRRVNDNIADDLQNS